jgi:predicted membrane channel-forming protein YqfA (hemolysin III family)
VRRMALLDPPRCPNCNSEIDLKDLWRLAPKSGRGSRFAGKIGVVCPVCGTKLRVLDGRLQLTSVALFILMACSAAVLGKLSRPFGNERAVLVCFGALYLLGFIFFQKAVPHLLKLRLFEEGEQAGFPLVTLAEDLAAERDAIANDPLNAEPATDSGPAWVCRKCHEENPGNFNECWKCLALRPEANS